MKEYEELKKIAICTIQEEVEAISALKNAIDDDFVKCVEKIFQSNGRVIVTGIGKSAHVGAKIVATLNSTGTPAIFMHARTVCIKIKFMNKNLVSLMERNIRPCKRNIAPRVIGIRLVIPGRLLLLVI